MDDSPIVAPGDAAPIPRRYVRVSVGVGDHLRGRSTDARLVFLELLTSRQRGSVPGLILAGPAGFAEAVRLPLESVRAALAELGPAVIVDADEPLIFVPRGIEDDPPANPNVLKAWAAALAELPPCGTKRKVVAAVSAVLRTATMRDEWRRLTGATPEATDVDPVVKPFMEPLSQRYAESASASASDPASDPASERARPGRLPLPPALVRRRNLNTPFKGPIFDIPGSWADRVVRESNGRLTLDDVARFGQELTDACERDGRCVDPGQLLAWLDRGWATWVARRADDARGQASAEGLQAHFDRQDEAAAGAADASALRAGFDEARRAAIVNFR